MTEDLCLFKLHANRNIRTFELAGVPFISFLSGCSRSCPPGTSGWIPEETGQYPGACCASSLAQAEGTPWGAKWMEQWVNSTSLLLLQFQKSVISKACVNPTCILVRISPAKATSLEGNSHPSMTSLPSSH